ncbi:MAG: MarC family protein [Sedimentisphaerales bacterium]|nr:MarC family protein [Sedimentisphaerales bacterium]
MDLCQNILIDTLYLLALINPISKISILAVISPVERDELANVVRRSTLIATCILLGAMFSGKFVLVRIFHVKLEALMAAGGFVLSWVGFHALRKGMFYEKETHAKFAELAIVPLACPMIAGPATIAATIWRVNKISISPLPAPLYWRF